MDCTQPTPRVNGAQLRLMEGKVVRLVGQVTAHEGATVTLECADGEKVSVQQTAGSAYETKYVEVVGRVVGANVVQEMDYTNFGDNFGTCAGQRGGNARFFSSALESRARLPPSRHGSRAGPPRAPLVRKMI